MRDTDRQSVLPVGKARRPDELDQRDDRQEWVLAPPFEALQHALAVDEAAVLVDCIPPEHPTELLGGELPGAAILSLEVLGAPSGDLPAECVFWQYPGVVSVPLPGGADERRLQGFDFLNGQG
ncbi:hypothetical protein AB0H73_18755 [Streptomyces olivoreticuli]